MSNKIHVDASSCPQNHPCPLLSICPVGAISQSGYKAPVINSEKCISCGSCVHFCAYQALSFV